MEKFLQYSPTYVFGGSGLVLACAWPVAKWWWNCGSSLGSWIPSVSLRLDVLVTSWIGAAFCGSRLWPNGGNNVPTGSTNKRLRPSTTSVTTSTVPASPARTGEASMASSSMKRGKEDSAMEDPNDEHRDHGAYDEGDDDDDDVSEGQAATSDEEEADGLLSSPLPQFPENDGVSCWSHPDCEFFVRGPNYLEDKVKIPSGAPPLTCMGVDFWLTDNPQRHIARHPSVLGGQLQSAPHDVFLVNFLLPFGNFCAYFAIPELSKFPPKLRKTWEGFLQGDQTYRDARLKLLPIVIEGPWIVKAAVGPGKSPALLGKVIPLQYYFSKPTAERKGIYEVDVIITASTIAKGILSVVKGHTKSVTIGFAFIIEAAEQAELPENVLCSFQIHSIHVEDCPRLPERNLDEIK